MPEGLRVVVTPGVQQAPGGQEAALRMSGDSGSVVSLASYGVRTLHRALSQAEVDNLRRALLGLSPGEGMRPRTTEDELLGLVCAGRRAPAEECGAAAIAVADHANLTWRSPLRGPNDDQLGPRFPVVAGLYRPQEALGRLGALPVEVVACVADDRMPTAFETEVVARHAIKVLSTELAPVALVAAHLGYHLAAVVLETGEDG